MTAGAGLLNSANVFAKSFGVKAHLHNLQIRLAVNKTAVSCSLP